VTILVLGASSAIGRALSAGFAAGNTVIASGRDRARLLETQQACREQGAQDVIVIEHDLSDGSDLPIENQTLSAVDLIVNAASAASRYRDDRLDHTRILTCIKSDAEAPLRLIARRLALSTVPLSIVYISSILAKLKSPNRAIYGGIKSLQEDCLKVIAETGAAHVLIARIGSAIPPDSDQRVWDRIAARILDGYRNGRSLVEIGAAGRVLLLAYAMHPGLARLAIRLQRVLRPVSAGAS
jgi:NADP-dependent 3-hydroxy acid dehydrogenase YdfG